MMELSVVSLVVLDGMEKCVFVFCLFYKKKILNPSFLYLFCLLFIFIYRASHTQVGIKIVQTLTIDLLTSIDPF